LAGLSTAVMLMITLYSLVTLVEAFVPLVGVWAAGQVADTGTGGPELLDQIVWFATSGLRLLLYLIAAILFIAWLYRARANLRGLPEAYPRLPAGLAVAGWFIPIANLLLPLFVVIDVGRASGCRGRIGRLAVAWWAAFVLAVLASLASLAGLGGELGRMRARLSAGTAVDQDRFGELVGQQVLWRLPGAVLFVAAAVLAMLVVARITAAQYDRIEASRVWPVPAQRRPTPAELLPPTQAVPPSPPGATIGA
jgi:hypothetical protein